MDTTFPKSSKLEGVLWKSPKIGWIFLPKMGKIFLLTKREICESLAFTGFTGIYSAFRCQIQCKPKPNKKFLIKLRILESLKMDAWHLRIHENRGYVQGFPSFFAHNGQKNTLGYFPKVSFGVDVVHNLFSLSTSSSRCSKYRCP